MADSVAEVRNLDWFPLKKVVAGYKREFIAGDLRAAINVALLAFPQGMAYALIAGLPIAYGIFGSVVAAIVGPFFSKTRFITLGPTNATAVMLSSAFAGITILESQKLAMMPMLVLMVGFFLVVGAYLKVATLIQYISRSVITGYITAAALLIVSGQIPNIAALAIEGKQSTFFGNVGQIVEAFPTAHANSIHVALATLAIYLVLHFKFKSLPNVAITLVLVTAGCAVIGNDVLEIKLISGFSAASLGLTLPAVNLDHINLLVSPAMAIALLCVLEGMSIGKDLSAKKGSRIDANQEMFSIGMANMGCSVLSGMPASGSLTRSTLSVTSGGRTQFASVGAGVIVLISAFLLAPVIQYIPRSALAVLVVVISVSLINRHAIRIVTHATRSDAAVFFTTFLGGMFLRLDHAIYIGVSLSIILFLKKVARPEMVEYCFNEDGQLAELEDTGSRDNREVSIVHVEGELFFGAAEVFRDQMRRVCEDPNLSIVVLKMRNAHNMDATAAMALEELVKYMRSMDRHLIVCEARPDLIRVLKNSGVYDMVGEENIFDYEPRNPTLSTARALKHVQKFLGDAEATVSIYVDPVRDKEKGKATPK